MPDCLAVVWRLVPYHDARFGAACAHLDLGVIEVFGQLEAHAWADQVTRPFVHVTLATRDVAADRPALWARLEAELDRQRPRVVCIQGWSDPAAFRTAHWALRNDARIVIFSESNRYDHARKPHQEWIKSRVLGVCDAALVGGRDHVAYLAALGFPADRVSLGYNVIDNAHFAPPDGRAGGGLENPYFLVGSRLVENKNLARLIEAYAVYRAKARSKPWDLVILGTGELEADLQAQIARLGLEGHARLEGFRKYHDLPAIYHGAGALVHASLWEPWGLVVNEAMAAGLPVIVSAPCGSVCELVRHGENGFVFDPQDVPALTGHMLALADGAVDRAAFGARSLAIIAGYGPARFGAGLAEAVGRAGTAGRRAGVIDRLVIAALARRT